MICHIRYLLNEKIKKFLLEIFGIFIHYIDKSNYSLGNNSHGFTIVSYFTSAL